MFLLETLIGQRVAKWSGPLSGPGWIQTATEMTFLGLSQPTFFLQWDDCVHWWLSSCHGSVAELWRLKYFPEYLHVTFSHENTMTQVSSFTLWKFHLKNLTLHMNMHSIFMARFLVVYKYFVMSIVVPSLVSSLAHSSLAVSDEC